MNQGKEHVLTYVKSRSFGGDRIQRNFLGQSRQDTKVFRFGGLTLSPSSRCAAGLVAPKLITPRRRGKESIPEKSDNFHVLTQPAARENFAVRPDLFPWDRIKTSHSFYPSLEGSLANMVTIMQEEPSFTFTWISCYCQGSVCCHRKTKLVMYLSRNNEECSRDHWNSGDATNIKCYECNLYSCLNYQQANCIFSTPYYSVNGSLSNSILFFHIISNNAWFLGKKEKLLNIKCVFWFY